MSQQAKHTDSPWTFDVDAYGYPKDIMAADGWPFARAIAYHPLSRRMEIKEEMLSYVRLATAAPDLLAALEAAIPYVERAYECAFPDSQENAAVLEQARAAIAKAKGAA